VQTKAADEKFCSECAAVIKAKAVVCPQCGCPQGPVAPTGSTATGHGRNKNTAGILSLLLGGIGVHKFYLGKPGAGLLYALFCWTFIPVLLALIDAVKLFGMSTQAFDAEYNREFT
jgi:TM2 domain-containing membrane protein YozV